MQEKPTRSKSLSVEDRQTMLIDAITPLLVEHGDAVTTKQIAECAGIAEGTIFRAFGSKDELIQAAVAKAVDPEPFRQQLLAVDPELALEERVRAIVGLLRARFTTVFTLLTALGGHRGPHNPRHELTEIMAEALAPDLERLRFTPTKAAQIVRMVTLAASVPQIRAGADFDDDEIASMILFGIIGSVPPES